MEVYHGTSRLAASDIKKNGIKSLGGGELGRGFYVGNMEHMAFIWAIHTKGKGNACIICFDFDDNHFLELNPLILERDEAIEIRKRIKSIEKQREYVFGSNAIWADVVGINHPGFEQIKFEEVDGIKFINKANKKYVEK